MKKIFGWIILISSIIILLTIWIDISLPNILLSLSVGLNGIFDAIDLITGEKESEL